jgi:ribosome-binding protein aMBF1 (putative translation factor)
MPEAAAEGRRRATPDHSPLLRRFGANLGQIREEKDLTQEELAARAGIGLELLKEIEEAGGHMPNVSVVL